MPAAYNTEEVLATHILQPIHKEIVRDIYSKSPFIIVPGTFNARDLAADTEDIRPGLIYRSGSLENLSTPGFAVLRKLGIRTIFDLRSLKETTAHPDPTIEGIRVVWQPSTVDNPTVAASDTIQAKVANGLDVHTMYKDLLESHKMAFRAVFYHILHMPGVPFIIHCTAGKDRTGVLSALILSLAGADVEDIQRDYMLTRVGVEPVREFLLGKIMQRRQKMDLDSAKAMAALDFPSNAMKKLLSTVDKKFGGVEGYVRYELGFGKHEVEAMKRNLSG
ncbi:Tyrosine-protein phosphatase [Pseudocercospora fuligena]|uniref:Tyrosine-protein phosphatase n=1 Tax=Pseudocercospora fuligena TaxID=685502 RepID=A0A8H6RFK7_9PEZI|nr:Tyrosine-protein phosphatase [Pseudocercospora fuligena]